MPYQFQCPQGHLLEGEPEQAGQPCNCPVCGQLFLIPPPPAPSIPAGQDVVEPPAGPAEQPVSFDPTGTSAPNTLLHIPCPNGHELEVPRDMLDQFVECPHCGEQFHLREKNSVEYRKKKAAEMERKWERRGQAWLHWAIIFAVMVVLGLITLIALS